jgi:hypothetical protein
MNTSDFVVKYRPPRPVVKQVSAKKHRISLEECLFWLYLKAGHIDRAMEIFDQGFDFKVVIYDQVSQLFGLQILDHIDKFQNAKELNLTFGAKIKFAPGVMKQRLIRSFVKSIEESPEDEFSLTAESLAKCKDFIEAMMEKNICINTISIMRIIMMLCLSENSFDTKLFETYSEFFFKGTTNNPVSKLSEVKNPSSHEYEVFTSCLHSLGSKPKLITDFFIGLRDFIRYCATILNPDTIKHLVTEFCDSLYTDCTDRDDKNEFLMKIYNTLEDDFGIKLDLDVIFSNIDYHNTLGIMKNPLNLFCLDKGFNYGDTHTVSTIFNQIEQALDSNLVVDLDECLEILRKCIDDGGFNPEEHNADILHYLASPQIEKILSVEILDKFKDVGFDFSSIQHYGLYFTSVNKIFVEYLLDSFETLEPECSTLFLCLSAGRLDDCDRLFKLASDETKEDFFDFISGVEDLEHKFFFLAEDANFDIGILKLVSIVPIEKYEHIISKIVTLATEIFEKMTDLDTFSDFIESIFDMFAKTTNLDLKLWQSILEIIPEKYLDDLVWFLLLDVNSKFESTCRNQLMLKYTIEKLNLNLFNIIQTKMPKFGRSVEWIFNDDVSKELFNMFPPQFKINNVSYAENEHGGLAVKNFIFEEPTEISLNFVLKYISDGYRVFYGDFEQKSYIEEHTKKISNVQNQLVDCIQADLFADEKTRSDLFSTLLCAHVNLSQDKVREFLQLYAASGLSFENVHLMPFNSKDHNCAWLNNKHIVQFVLEQNDLL